MLPELVGNQGRVRFVVLAGDLGGRFLSGDFSVGVDGPAKCWVMTVAVRPHKKTKSGTANPGPASSQSRMHKKMRTTRTVESVTSSNVGSHRNVVPCVVRAESVARTLWTIWSTI